MKNLPTLLMAAFTVLCIKVAAQTYTISGYVEDASSGEKLIGANVYNAETFIGTSSNIYGFYSFSQPAGQVKLAVSFVGFKTYTVSLNLTKDTTINVNLIGSNELKEVEVVASKAEKVQERTDMSVISIPIKTIEKLPMLMGERDVMKALQLLPGVQSGSEGSSGLYVRGGGPDQNLILLDGVPVYNASHLFGFFSVFNPDAINSVELVKGGFPSQYGGRLSSVVDIRMKEGNMKEFHGAGSVGIVSSKLTLEGPIVKDKASFIVSGRRTYIDLLARPIIKTAFKRQGTNGVLGYYFYDLNGKANWKISEKDRLYLSAYSGDDNFYFNIAENYQNDSNSIESKINVGLGWGNITTALRYNRVITNKLFMNLTGTYSRYNFSVGQSFEEISTPTNPDIDFNYSSEYNSGIYDWSGRLDFDYIPNPKHYIKFGLSDIYHIFVPGVNVFKAAGGGGETGIDTTLGASRIYAHEYFAYVQDDFKIGTRFKANIGLHFSGFVTSNDHFYALQPRISTRYLINEHLSVKASYAEMQQYIHLLTNTTIGLPTDLWVPSTKNVRPENSQQIAAGLAYTFREKFEITLEGYYKWMNGLIEYKEGASYFDIAGDWQDKIEFGRGWSYGTELFIQKKVGDLTGWIGYTLSWTNRQFDNLNNGNPFPYRYDRRHDASLVLTYDINDHIDIGAAWVYGTGNAVSLPLERYLSANQNTFWQQEINHYEERNGFRMRAYHRMDLGINLHKEKKFWTRTWSFGAYNAYSRRNPFFMYFDQEYQLNPNGTTTAEKRLVQVSIFPIIPYATYSFKF